jgi:hypothetical protein
VLIRAIVVTGNCASANVHPGANLAVADIGEVINLGAQSNNRLFDLYKVTNVCATC